MSQIPDNQGSIKVSEVAIDLAQNVFGTLDQEDGLTLVAQIRKVTANLLRKTSFLLISDGVITWNGSTITNNGNNILLKFNQNPTAGVITVTIPSSLLNGFPISNTQILYFKCSRNDLLSSFTASVSNVVVSTEASMPAMLASTSDSSDDPTIFVPLLARYDVGTDQSVWWVPHGIFWPENTTSVIGSIITGTIMPNGLIAPLHIPGDSIPLGTPALSTTSPGWALCDGTVIVSIQSSFNNSGRDLDGFPNATYSLANDRFTPQLNGPLQPWQTSFVYVRGDMVRNNASTQSWAALSNFTSGTGSGYDPNAAFPAAWSAASSYVTGDFVIDTEASVNGSGQPVTIIFRALSNNGPTATTPYQQGTSVWQRIWSTDLTQNGSPFKRSGFNSGAPNTYIRGATASPSSSAAFGGNNSNTHTHDMQNHTHTANHAHSSGSLAARVNLGDNSASDVLAVQDTSSSTWSLNRISSSIGSNSPGGRTSSRGAVVEGFTSTASLTTSAPSNNNTSGPTDTNNEPRQFSAAYIIKIF